jgi:hypothetical protein
MIVIPVKSRLAPMVLDSGIEVLYLRKQLISLRGSMISDDNIPKPILSYTSLLSSLDPERDGMLYAPLQPGTFLPRSFPPLQRTNFQPMLVKVINQCADLEFIPGVSFLLVLCL